MRIGLISTPAWRTPPRHYGPWERVVSLITEGLIDAGIDVTLFATADSITKAKLIPTVEIGYEEDKTKDPKVLEYLHLSEIFLNADKVDLLHNNYDFMPLVFTNLIKIPMLTTIHGFSSPKILAIYEKYNKKTYYSSISDADRADKLDYISTVYHGIDIESFDFNEFPEDYLLYFGRIHHDKGTKEAIELAKKTKRKLIIAGIIQDQKYYQDYILPYINNEDIIYAGHAGPEKRNTLLRNAYALVHPINFNEPFGLSVVESMACGTPVIAYPKGSMPEIITDGIDGYLPETFDDFINAIKDVKNINRRACRKKVENKFTQKIMVENYIDIYKTILEEYS